MFMHAEVITWDMFQRWLISATGCVATEHPHPTTASLTGASRIPSKNASRDDPWWHWTKLEKVFVYENIKQTCLCLHCSLNITIALHTAVYTVLLLNIVIHHADYNLNTNCPSILHKLGRHWINMSLHHYNIMQVGYVVDNSTTWQCLLLLPSDGSSSLSLIVVNNSIACLLLLPLDGFPKVL